jgi:hypothetical protein
MPFNESCYWTSTQSDFGAYLGDSGPGGGYYVEIGIGSYREDVNGNSIPFESSGNYADWTSVQLYFTGPLNGLSVRCVKIPPKK